MGLSILPVLVTIATVLVAGLLNTVAYQVQYEIPEGGLKHYKAKEAECEATPEVVDLLDLIASREPFILYSPSCTRLDRCTGCHQTETWKLNYTTTLRTLTMTRSKYDPNTGRYDPMDSVPLVVEVHSKCRLFCSITQCKTKYMELDEKMCKCNCKPTRCSKRYKWNDDICDCKLTKK